MFLPNTFATVSKMAGYNVHGEPSFDPERKVPCGVVRLGTSSERTSVRTDSSASGGNAEETVSAGKLLFPATSAPTVGSRVVIQGITLRIFKIEPRLSINGNVDHFEVELEAWTN